MAGTAQCARAVAMVLASRASSVERAIACCLRRVEAIEVDDQIARVTRHVSGRWIAQQRAAREMRGCHRRQNVIRFVALSGESKLNGNRMPKTSDMPIAMSE